MAAIGLVGVGNMGGAMALRLIDGGHAVAVRDLRPEAEAPLAAAGATVAPSPASLAAGCELLIVAVVDAAQTHDVLFGPDGAAAAMKPGTTVMLCPTIGPADVEATAGALAAAGLAWIDAPMSGGPARARDGSMSLMVACDDPVWARWQPLLGHLASRLHRVGTRAGDGARTKLVNNLLAAIQLAGMAEVMALADAMGLDLATVLGVVEQSSGQSWIGSDRMRRWLAGDGRPLAHMRLLAKDSGLALAAGEAAAVDLPLGAQAAQAFAQACADGLASADDAALIGHLRQRLQRRRTGGGRS